MLHRKKDTSGISGTGVVAQGVESDSGKVALFWLTAPRSVAFYDSSLDLTTIHGHRGRTVIKWLDPENGSRSAKSRKRTKGET